MSKPLVVSIPHHLGKDEAVRRLESGLGNAQANYSNLFAVQEEVWTGDRLQFRVGALGQMASGTIDVADDHVKLEVYMPWLLAASRGRDPAAGPQGRHPAAEKKWRADRFK